MEVTIKIDMRTKAAKAFFKYLKALPFVEVKEKGLSKPKTESPYNPEFVKMVKKSAASKKRYVINDIDEFWESL